MNLCIVNEDHPQCNVPRKAIKARPGRGREKDTWGGLVVGVGGASACPLQSIFSSDFHCYWTLLFLLNVLSDQRCSDEDSGQQGPCVMAETNKFTRTTKILWRKGTAQLLSKWERAPAPAWTGFYCFSGYITLRMVLIYCAQVHYRWLPFTDNKGKNVANYFKEKDVTDQGEKWLNWLQSTLGRFSTDFRKLKILSKHLLPQFRVSLSSLGTLQA